jgi:hypothetical protein
VITVWATRDGEWAIEDIVCNYEHAMGIAVECLANGAEIRLEYGACDELSGV